MRILSLKRRAAGTTLAEVLTATAILGAVTAAILGAVFNGFFIMERVRENQRATQIILEKVETIRLYSWSQVNSNGFIPPTFTQPYDPQAVAGSKGITYRGTFEISPFPYTTSYSDNMRQVTVTLRWTSERNLQRQRTFVTYIARNGLQNYVY
ncbi:MAG TPA: hypothetical protein VFZ59_19190 [Verrucomicrobiae bacterium]|nr:hypothetical protein [Verrucomicrobiae bacterium]